MARPLRSLSNKPTLILGIGPARSGTSYLFSLFMNDNFNISWRKEDMYLTDNPKIDVEQYKKTFRTTDKDIFVDVNPRYSLIGHLEDSICQLKEHFNVKLICTVRDPVNSVISGIEAASMSYSVYEEHYDYSSLISKYDHHDLYVKFTENYNDFDILSDFVGAQVNTHTHKVNINQRNPGVVCTEPVEDIRRKMNGQYNYFFFRYGEVFIKTIWEHA